MPIITKLTSISEIVSEINSRGYCSLTTACMADYVNAPIRAEEHDGKLCLYIDTPDQKEFHVFSLSSVLDAYTHKNSDTLYLRVVDQTGLTNHFSVYPKKEKEDYITRQINQTYNSSKKTRVIDPGTCFIKTPSA